jgi:hypothetical protein
MGHELKKEPSAPAPEKGSHWNWPARGSDLREEQKIEFAAIAPF